MGQLAKLYVPIPPLPIQNQFAQIVQKTEFHKTKYQSSLQELENIYGSLTQRAFRGELDLSGIPVELSAKAEAVTRHEATLEVIPKAIKKDADQNQLAKAL